MTAPRSGQARFSLCEPSARIIEATASKPPEPAEVSHQAPAGRQEYRPNATRRIQPPAKKGLSGPLKAKARRICANKSGAGRGQCVSRSRSRAQARQGSRWEDPRACPQLRDRGLGLKGMPPNCITTAKLRRSRSRKIPAHQRTSRSPVALECAGRIRGAQTGAAREQADRITIIANYGNVWRG